MQSSQPTRTLELLERLIAHPTVVRTPNVELMADVAEQLSAMGARVEVMPSTRPDAQNLHAVFGPADAEGAILLSAHTDVVSVEGQPWTRDPFKLDVDAGRAYGRGSTDMKGFIAAALAAIEGFDRRRLRRPVELALSSDEEAGCVGVRPLLDSLAVLSSRPALVLVGEPTEMRVVDHHKGKAALRVTLRGRAAHSGLPHLGVNAVAYAGRLITELLELQDELTRGPREETFLVPHSTVGAGPIRGGTALNIVPDACLLEIDIRCVPDVDPSILVARVEAICGELEREMQLRAPECAVSVEQFAGYPGLRSSSAGELPQPLRELAASGIGGVDYGTEGGLYQQRLEVPVVVCGPGSMSDAHGPDESVALDQLVRAEALITGLLHELC